MRHRSKKQEALYRQRRPFVERLLEENPACQACPVFAAYDGRVTFQQRYAVDVHEMKRRSQGGSILDERNCLTVCRRCHNMIGNNPALAESLGLALPGWAEDWMYDEAHHVRLSWTNGEPVTPEWLKDDA